MKNKTKNILNLMLMTLLIVGLIFPVDAFNMDYRDLHPDEATYTNNIGIKEKTLWDNIFGPFVIYTNQGTYQPGNTATFTYEATSWNLNCRAPGVIIEIYNPDGFVQSLYKTLSSINGNQDFLGSLTYSIPSN